jgi:hypothetical protein
MNANALLNLSVSQLKRAAEIKEQIGALTAELSAMLGGSVTKSIGGIGRGRGMSEEGRRRIAAAQRARWAKLKGTASAPAQAKKRTMSAAARRKIAAAAKARWARVRAAKKPV